MKVGVNYTYESLRKLCEQGLTLQRIADEIGCTRQYVHILLGYLPELKSIRADRAGERLTGKQRLAIERQLKNDRHFGGMSKEVFVSDALRAEQRLRLLSKKHNARSRALDFDITWPDLYWPTHCPVLGLELDYYASSGRRSENSTSFDRIDPSLGYVKDNVRIISWRANRIKNDGTADEHRAIAAYIDSQR